MSGNNVKNGQEQMSDMADPRLAELPSLGDNPDKRVGSYHGPCPLSVWLTYLLRSFYHESVSFYTFYVAVNVSFNETSRLILP